MSGTKRGRPKKASADKALRCECGGTSGIGLCKKAVYCFTCGQCRRARAADDDCATIPSPHRSKLRTSSPTRTSKGTGALSEHEEGPYAEVPEFTPTKDRTRTRDPVTHCDLSLPTAAVIDLAKAFGHPRFFLRGADKTPRSLRAAIHALRKYSTGDKKTQPTS